MRSPSFVLMDGGVGCGPLHWRRNLAIRRRPRPSRGDDHPQRLPPRRTPPAPGWQDCALMHSQAASHGKISPRCVPEGASDGKSTGSWQHIAAMYSNTANFGKICVACIRKAPQSAVGEYTARASCHQGAFSPSEALRSCTAHKSCHPLMDLALAQGRLPQHPANTCHLPPANTCRLPYPPPALRQCSSSRRIQLSANARRRAIASARRCAFSASFRSVANLGQRPIP